MCRHEEVFDVARGRGLSAVVMESKANSASAKAQQRKLKSTMSQPTPQKPTQQSEQTLQPTKSKAANALTKAPGLSATKDKTAKSLFNVKSTLLSGLARVVQKSRTRRAISTAKRDDSPEKKVDDNAIVKPMDSTTKRNLQQAIESSKQLNKSMVRTSCWYSCC